MQTTAERIIAINNQETHKECMTIEGECRELAVKTEAQNCYDRIFYFYDGSSIKKTHDGYSVN